MILFWPGSCPADPLKFRQREASRAQHAGRDLRRDNWEIPQEARAPKKPFGRSERKADEFIVFVPFDPPRRSARHQ